MTLSCVQDFSCTGERIGTKFAWIKHLGIIKTQIGFGYLALIFKVTAELNVGQI